MYHQLPRDDLEAVYFEDDGILVVEKKAPHKLAAGEEEQYFEENDEPQAAGGWDVRPLVFAGLVTLLMVLCMRSPMMTMPRPSFSRSSDLYDDGMDQAPLVFDNPLPDSAPVLRQPRHPQVAVRVPTPPPPTKVFVDPLDNLRFPLKVNGVEHLANDVACLPCFFNDTGRVRRAAVDESQESFMLYGVPGFQRFEITTHIYNPETGPSSASTTFFGSDPFQFFIADRLDADAEDGQNQEVWNPIPTQYERVDSLLNWEKGVFSGETSPNSRYIKIQFGHPAFWSNWRPQIGQISIYLVDSEESQTENAEVPINMIPEDAPTSNSESEVVPLAGFTTSDSTSSKSSDSTSSTSSSGTSPSTSSVSSAEGEPTIYEDEVDLEMDQVTTNPKSTDQEEDAAVAFEGEEDEQDEAKLMEWEEIPLKDVEDGEKGLVIEDVENVVEEEGEKDEETVGTETENDATDLDAGTSQTTGISEKTTRGSDPEDRQYDEELALGDPIYDPALEDDGEPIGEGKDVDEDPGPVNEEEVEDQDQYEQDREEEDEAAWDRFQNTEEWFDGTDGPNDDEIKDPYPYEHAYDDAEVDRVAEDRARPTLDEESP